MKATARGKEKEAGDAADAALLAELRTSLGARAQEIALALLNSGTRRDTLRVALAWLRENPVDATRPNLIALYDHYARNNGAHDYGTFVRADIVRALHPIARREDSALFGRAVRTYEFPPPQFVEEGALLRSAGLVALAELDLDAARFHAARLLVDEHTDAMSGEPAVSAATVLAALDEGVLLYSYAWDARNGKRAEVVAECLRGLKRIDPDLLPGLIERMGSPPNPVIRIGMIDLMLRHESGVQQVDWLVNEVKTAPAEHLRYLLFTAIGQGDNDLLARFVDVLQSERDWERRAAARDALSLVEQRADVKTLLNAWKR
jgi:hypothetical protein